MKAFPKNLGLRLAVILAALLLVGLVQSGFVNANPSLPPDIPPIVAVSTVNINASIIRQDNQFWASIDAEYVTGTIHGFGESYYLPIEHIYPSDNSSYKLTVVTDMLEADYPIPLNTTNISVEVNGEEQEWYLKEQSIYHLYGSNMKRIGWVMQPTPREFTVTVHYEHPLLKTGDTEQALILPLGQRYGSTEAPYYPLYDWYSQINPVISVCLQPENPDLPIKAYSVYGNGSMNQLTFKNSGLTENSKYLTITRNQTQIPLGLLFLTEQTPLEVEQPFLTEQPPLEVEQPDFIPVILASLILIIIGITLGVRYYSEKHQK